jgi:hypothetical protein
MRTTGLESLGVSQHHLRLRLPVLLLALFAFVAAPAVAQSPNTASMIVNVVEHCR